MQPLLRLTLLVAMTTIITTYSMRYLTSFPHPVVPGEVVLITGAGSGIGRDAALVLCGMGIHVVACARTWHDVKFSSSESKAANNCDVKKFITYLEFDVKDSVASLSAIDTAVDLATRYGTRYAAIVQSAGYADNVPVELATEAAVRDVFDVNFFAVWRMIHASIPHFRRNKGRIVTIGSIAGHLTGIAQSSYASSKHALEALHDSLRRELTQFGVSSTLIDPGCVKSALFRYVLGGPHDPFTRIPKEKMTGYEWIPAKNIQELGLCEKFAADARHSSSVAISDALTSFHPDSHYYPGTYFLLPAKALVYAAWWVPEKIIDWGVSWHL